ncbi:MAG: PEGA domain-containing protein, partial [Kofleriaceae bacterium]
VRELALPAAALAMVGVGVGLAVKSHAPAGTPLDVQAAFTPPKIVVAPKPAPPPVPPKLVDVRLESTPSGASATLLDNTTGSSTPLGSTPVMASLDPGKQYDVRFELEGHRSATQHLDPATSTKLEVALAAPEPEVEAAPAPVIADKHHHHGRHAAAKKAAAKRVATAPAARHGDDPIAALGHAAKTRGVKPATEQPGFVSITTSVPCAILLDGTNTGKSTPAKLTVPAGHHSIRLIAAAQHVNKQVGVDVTAKKTTRINQAF